jgi:hypothetical protein
MCAIFFIKFTLEELSWELIFSLSAFQLLIFCSYSTPFRTNPTSFYAFLLVFHKISLSFFLSFTLYLLLVWTKNTTTTPRLSFRQNKFHVLKVRNWSSFINFLILYSNFSYKKSSLNFKLNLATAHVCHVLFGTSWIKYLCWSHLLNVSLMYKH